MFQNAPNGIGACLDFQSFPGGGCPRIPLCNGPPAYFNTEGVILRMQNAERITPNAREPKQAKPSQSAIQANQSGSLNSTPVSLNIAQLSLRKRPRLPCLRLAVNNGNGFCLLW